MIEINLLPHREAKRAADLRQSGAVLVLGLVVVVGSIVLVRSQQDQAMSLAQASVAQLQADIERYKPQEAKVAAFKQQRSELEDKLGVIRGLDRARSGPVRVFDELATHTPDRLWLTSLETKSGGITLKGESLDNGVVADFLRNLNTSAYFVDVDLDSTSRGKEVEGVRVVAFVITARLTTPKPQAPKEEA